VAALSADYRIGAPWDASGLRNGLVAICVRSPMADEFTASGRDISAPAKEIMDRQASRRSEREEISRQVCWAPGDPPSDRSTGHGIAARLQAAPGIPAVVWLRHQWLEIQIVRVAVDISRTDRGRQGRSYRDCRARITEDGVGILRSAPAGDFRGWRSGRRSFGIPQGPRLQVFSRLGRCIGATPSIVHWQRIVV